MYSLSITLIILLEDWKLLGFLKKLVIAPNKNKDQGSWAIKRCEICEKNDGWSRYEIAKCELENGEFRGYCRVNEGFLGS